jgi:hypothetical protein
MTAARKKFYIDLAERVGSTFVEAFLGFVLMDAQDVINIDTAEKAFWAGVIAAAAVLKGGLARFRGDRENPSLVSPPIRTTLTDN